MMFFHLTSVILGLILFSTAVSANTRESLTLKVFDSNFQMGDSQLMTLLKQADLERHGYKKEITVETVKEPGIDRPIHHKAHFYFKIVNCSRLQEITQELQTLLQGAIGMEMITRSNREFKTTNMINMRQCKVGLELHFKADESDPDNKSKTRLRAKRAANVCIGICINCGAKDTT